MDRGTYTSASLGLAELRKLEIVNNNLANVNTPGFKRQVLVGDAQSFDQTLASLSAGQDPYARGDHERTPGVVNLRSQVDFSQGPIKFTGGQFDVALTDPKEFFVVNTPSGPQYTRAGNFTLNQEGSLVTQDGFEVQGDGGALSITGLNARINENGGISVGGNQIGRLQIARFENPAGLEPVGSTRFKLKAGETAPAAVESAVLPGSLEMSNVSSISSMIDLISANRGFETYTKTAQTIDQMNQTAISQIGRPR